MKKILAICFLLLMAACAQQQTVVQEPVQKVQEPVVEKVEEAAPPAPEPQPEPEPVIEIDETVQGFIETATEKVTGFSFVYVGPPENLPTDSFFVRGDKVKVELLKATDYLKSQPFSHVYINTKSGSATAFCEARDTKWCPEGVKNHGSVNIDDYMVRTPYQWLMDLQTAESLGNGPQWEKKSTTKVKFTTTDGASGEMYIVDFHALPVRVSLDSGDEIEFRDLAINSVKNEDVTPP